jgi:FtsH-binding integral membrane protein
MENLNEINESQYQADFLISENYIKFTGELLRLSLFVIGGFGAVIMLIIKGENKVNVFESPWLIISTLAAFVLCIASSLAHRYCATDSLSWYISWLRAKKSQDADKALKEKNGFYKLLKYSRITLITSEVSFGFGVFFFVIAIINSLI